MAQDSPDLPAMVPDYGASAAEVLLQVWLRSILQQNKGCPSYKSWTIHEHDGFQLCR